MRNMNTYEATVQVIFMLDAESEEDARAEVEQTLMNIAYDWGNVEVH
jgi:hypothetical protein